MRVLSDDDVASVLELPTLLDIVADALRAQGRGDVERPDRPHFPVGEGLVADGSDGVPSAEPLGTGLVMPAYVHGADHYATKVVGVHEGNDERGLPTVNATVTLTAAETGLPAATMAGSRVTNARTGCIGGLAAREFAPETAEAEGGITLGVIGAGEQARWQTRAIAAAVDLDRVRVYSPSDSRERCAADLRALGIDATAVTTPRDAVTDADVVVTATTATAPVFDGDDLASDALVVAVGAYTGAMRELDDRTLERASHLFADVPEEAAETGDFPTHEAEDLTPLSDGLDGRRSPRESLEGIVVVASVGTAVLDAAAAEHVYKRAKERGVGTDVPL